MSIVRQPGPIRDLPTHKAVEQLYQLNQGGIDQFNARIRGFSFGSTVSHDAPAGNIDAVHITFSFAPGATATQTYSTSHNLGRKPIGFKMVNADGPLNLFSNTAITTNADTNVYLGAWVIGANTVTGAAWIW